MLITSEQLHEMIPFASDRKIDMFLVPLSRAMQEFHIVKPMQIAAFIAQITHESGSFNYVEEIHDGSNYEFRKDLGNLDHLALEIAHANYTTTGKWYKGRGLIQITGYYNYAACGKALELDLIRHPKLLAETEPACRSAGWYWDSHNLNNFADVGLFGATTKAINGGFNGAADRLANYARCRKVLNCE